jgi:hypothetical protein
MNNYTLERQAKSNDELVHRLIEERDRLILVDPNVNPSSSFCTVNFAQINLQTTDTSVGGTTMPIPSTQSINHFHSRTTIDDLAPTFGLP